MRPLLEQRLVAILPIPMPVSYKGKTRSRRSWSFTVLILPHADVDNYGMEPTNDPDLLAADIEECGYACTVCHRSVCLNDTHQNWMCLCDHSRKSHLLPGDYWGRNPSVRHPHRCYVSGCGCEALTYMRNEDAIAGLLGVVEDLET